jgi:hypothetical protein
VSAAQWMLGATAGRDCACFRNRTTLRYTRQIAARARVYLRQDIK